MVIFKVFQEFLLPSVFVFALLVLGLVFYFSKKKKTGKILIILGIAFYYLFSITPFADLVLKPLERKYPVLSESDLGKSDKIVLLLGGKESDVLRASEVLRISQYKKSQIPNPNAQIIISGTSTLNPEENPALEIKEYLSERGIPKENIILEDKSRTTFESAKNIKELIDEEPFFLVTSAYHLPRSMEVFQKIGTGPIPAPTDFKHTKSARSAEASRNANAPMRIGDYDILDFFPDGKNLEKSDLAFHEYFGIIFYRLCY